MTFTEAFQEASTLQNGTLAVKVVYEYQEEVDKIEIPMMRKQEIQKQCIQIQKRKLEKFRNESYPLRKYHFEKTIMVFEGYTQDCRNYVEEKRNYDSLSCNPRI